MASLLIEFRANSVVEIKHYNKEIKGSAIFDITRICPYPLQQDFEGRLYPPKPDVCKNEPEVDKCPECDGEGEVEIEEYVGKNWYSATCECQMCDGDGKILANTEDSSENEHYYIDTEYNGIKSKLPTDKADFIFSCVGKPCEYGANYVLIGNL